MLTPLEESTSHELQTDQDFWTLKVELFLFLATELLVKSDLTGLGGWHWIRTLLNYLGKKEARVVPISDPFKDTKLSPRLQNSKLQRNMNHMKIPHGYIYIYHLYFIPSGTQKFGNVFTHDFLKDIV